jgi:hypothetical protein
MASWQRRSIATVPEASLLATAVDSDGTGGDGIVATAVDSDGTEGEGIVATAFNSDGVGGEFVGDGGSIATASEASSLARRS